MGQHIVGGNKIGGATFGLQVGFQTAKVVFFVMTDAVLTIVLGSSLGFLGLGVQPPTPEWGLMISLGASQLILGEWWPSVFPGLAMTITVFGYAAIARAFEEWFR